MSYYTDEQASHLLDEHQAVLGELRDLMLQVILQSQGTDHPRVREYLAHGVARRIKVMHRAIQNLYSQFPPSTKRPLNEDVLSDVQINLQAFVMNLYGVFDNCAWAFVYKHSLETVIKRRQDIGLFNPKTAQYLPQVIKEYLSSAIITQWCERYLKSYRDSLAHRIPLYIPPAEITTEEGERYNRLETEKVECIKTRQWARLEEVYSEQALIGVPSFAFLHSFFEDDSLTSVAIHPQILNDARTIVEFGMLFLKHWHERA